MERKLIGQGRGGVTIYLPKKWAREHKLKEGDTIHLDIIDDGLVVKAEKLVNKEIVDLTTAGNLLNRIIAAKYMKGVDEIEAYVNSTEQSRLVQKRADLFIGMEVIEQSKQRLLLKDLNKDSEDTLTSISKRILFLLQTISDESLEAMKKGDFDLDYLQDMEVNVNKFTDYCFRLLNRKGFGNSYKKASYYTILFLLELLGDEYKAFVKFIMENNRAVNKDILKLYAAINTLHKHITEIFLNFSQKKAVTLAEEYYKINDELRRLLKVTTNKQEAIILMHYRNIKTFLFEILNETMKLH